jgi:RNA polymerase sigma-70 factor, ECF subfamily
MKNEMREPVDVQWREALLGPQRDEALARLRQIIMRGLQHALSNRSDVTADDIEDFAQETLIRVMRELDSFRGEALFTTWVQKIAIRVAFTELRHKRWHDVSLQSLMEQAEQTESDSALMTAGGAGTAQLATERVMMATIQRIIREDLTDRQRQAMMAVIEGGMPLQDVAQHMGTSRNAMYKLLFDARRKLQARMLEEGLTAEDVLSVFNQE